MTMVHRLVLAGVMLLFILCMALDGQEVFHFENDGRSRFRAFFGNLGSRFRSWYNRDFFWLEVFLIIFYLAYIIFIM